MKAVLALSICICLFILVFLSKYDTWGISNGICMYHDSSVAVALMLSSILFLLNFLFFLFWLFFQRKKINDQHDIYHYLG